VLVFYENLFADMVSLYFSFKNKKYNAPGDVELLTSGKYAGSHQLFASIYTNMYQFIPTEIMHRE
jgi:hypothetical protein